jgi:hypothetical protein
LIRPFRTNEHAQDLGLRLRPRLIRSVHYTQDEPTLGARYQPIAVDFSCSMSQMRSRRRSTELYVSRDGHSRAQRSFPIRYQKKQLP